MIYTLVNHQYLGFVLEPHVVQVNSLGKFSLTHQRIFCKTADYFKKKISDEDFVILKILDELDDDFIFKKFNPEQKKKIKKSDFYTPRYCTDEFVNEKIRPHIEQRMNEVFNKLRGKKIYKTGNDNNPTSVELKVSKHKASVLFHFRRNEEGTRYFPTIKFNEQRTEFMFKGAAIATQNPAWMMLGSDLFDFEKNVDGKKLLPFLNKRFIQIPKNAEENYFNKFVAQLVERYDVYAEGFGISTQRPTGKAQLITNNLFDENVTLKLQFLYDVLAFDFDSDQRVSVKVKKQKDNYSFTRTLRNREFENQKKVFLESIGLLHLNGAFFTLKNIPIKEKKTDLLGDEGLNKYLFLEWLNENHLELEANGIEIKQDNEKSKYFIGYREIKIEVNEQRDWFDVEAVVKFGEYTFPFLSLRDNILRGKREFILPNGLIAIIPDEWFGNLSGILEFSTSIDDIKIEKQHIGLLEEIAYSGGKYLRLSDKLAKLKEYGQVRETALPQKFVGDLRHYQKAGFDWFYFLKENQFGGCLADDMGLGKTIQTLALLQKEKELYELNPLHEKQIQILPQNSELSGQINLFETSETNREIYLRSGGIVDANTFQIAQQGSTTTFIKASLIIVPNSLVFNWYNEAKKFTPSIKLLIYTGINRQKSTKDFSNYDLIITTYGTVRVDIDILKEFKFNYIILDESQAIKNSTSQASKSVKQLKSSNKLVLTGTPIENSVQELWSQLSFVNPGLLGSFSSFNEKFVQPIEKLKDNVKLQQLKAIIKPFVLRRTKDQVAKELPEKTEQIIYCSMTDEQAEAYETVKSHYRNEILKSIRELGLPRSQFTLLQGLTKLRQIANHPKLSNAEYKNGSGKFDEVIGLANTAKAEGHKVLLFSQFVKQLALYETYLKENKINYSYLDGSLSSDERQKAVTAFQNDKEIPFFLISLKAGGLGLNLTSADYVFLIDPWWNPAVERQAVDRTHRIGQTKSVFIYKFITKDTVEEKILAMQEKKKHLAESIITNEESFIKTIDIEEIMEILS